MKSARTSPPHREFHAYERMGWLRAAVLGANDGIVSTASLIIGVAAAGAAPREILVAGVAGLVAGAMSMAAGEYVSVSSQADAETADLAGEQKELDQNPEAERRELADIYVARGLPADLARDVAERLMAKDALAAHAQDELHLSVFTRARPLQAALASATAFTAGAAIPLMVAVVTPSALTGPAVAAASLLGLATLGATGARIGGASARKAALRVTFWGGLAMAATGVIGGLIGTVV